MLEPLGYKLGETSDSNGWDVMAVWETDALFVQAAYEARDSAFDVLVARPLPPYSPFMQPHSSKVHVRMVLHQRGLAVAEIEHESGRTPEGVRRYAAAGARDLTQISDILRGEHLDVLDQIVRRQHQGLLGIDLPD